MNVAEDCYDEHTVPGEKSFGVPVVAGGWDLGRGQVRSLLE